MNALIDRNMLAKNVTHGPIPQTDIASDRSEVLSLINEYELGATKLATGPHDNCSDESIVDRLQEIEKSVYFSKPKTAAEAAAQLRFMLRENEESDWADQRDHELLRAIALFLDGKAQR